MESVTRMNKTHFLGKVIPSNKGGMVVVVVVAVVVAAMDGDEL